MIASQAYLQERGIATNLTQSGLAIDSEKQWLVCSLDDLARNSSAKDQDGSTPSLYSHPQLHLGFIIMSDSFVNAPPSPHNICEGIRNSTL